MRIMLDPGALMPTRAHEDDAGLDLVSPVDILIPRGGHAIIDTGLHVELRKGTFGAVRGRSGLHMKHGIITDGTIDVGYTGSVRVRLKNIGDEGQDRAAGDHTVCDRHARGRGAI